MGVDQQASSQSAMSGRSRRFSGPKSTALIVTLACVMAVLLARAIIGPFLPAIGFEEVALTVDRIDMRTEPESICRQTFRGACVDRVNLLTTVCYITSREGERFNTSQPLCDTLSTGSSVRATVTGLNALGNLRRIESNQR